MALRSENNGGLKNNLKKFLYLKLENQKFQLLKKTL